MKNKKHVCLKLKFGKIDGVDEVDEEAKSLENRFKVFVNIKCAFFNSPHQT